MMVFISLLLVLMGAGMGPGWAATDAERVRVRLPSVGEVCGVVVLCPGQNMDGRDRVGEEEWKQFADKHHLALAGVGFRSCDEELQRGRGYFDATRGSGQALLDALEGAGAGGVPVYLLGFSGGAHFAMSFAAWRPEAMGALCVQGFSRWRPPPSEPTFPAVIACGMEDGPRLGAGLGYFQEGRRMGAPWAWVAIEELGHQPSLDLEAFFRDLIACQLLCQNCNTLLVDNATERKLTDTSCLITSSVLPCWQLWEHWRALHTP